MKCLFIVASSWFSVQYHSPVAARHLSLAWPQEIGRHLWIMSLYEGYPADFRHGGLGVFLPRDISTGERLELFEAFMAANPHVIPSV